MQKLQFLFFSFFLITSTNSVTSYAFELNTPLNNAPISYLGANNYKYTGWSVSAGDVDGDGINDLLIGGSPVYIILGKNIGRKTGTTIEDFADASFIAENSGDDFGDAVCMAGDVNNDGFDDILIGAKRFDTQRGKTYLVLGKESGWSMNTGIMDAVESTFAGENQEDWSGYAVAFAGDINNDGFDDFLIGAYMVDVGTMTNAGRTYLFLGKATGWQGVYSVADSDARFNGERMYDGSGRKVAPAGDVNNDAFDDFLISAPGDEVYLFFGKPTESWSGEISLTTADASFIGESPGDFAGWGVSSAGDVNNDGFDDILIGAEDYNFNETNNVGKTYLILGKPSDDDDDEEEEEEDDNGDWSADTPLSSADASFYGELAEDNLGKAVSAAGDVNNDGYDDFLIGATSANQWTGKAYLVYGKDGDWTTDTDIATADASFIGEATYDYAGFTMAPAGDINQDGSDDFIISAAYFGSYYTGKVYFFYGQGPVRGDLNSDGVVNLTDAIIGLKTISNTEQSIVFESGNDVNGDAALGMAEIIYTLQKAAGLR